MTWLKRLRCTHPRYAVKEIGRSVCLGWDALPHVRYEWEKTCRDCGSVIHTDGYVPNDPTTKRDASGWPVNEDGSRMKIVPLP